MLGRLSSHRPQSWGERANSPALLVVGFIAMGVIGVVISLSLIPFLRHRQAETADTLPTEQSISSVTALGYLAPQGKIVRLSAPVSNQRVTELRAKEGDRVEVGQIIAVMDQLQERQAAVNNTSAKVRVAQAQLMSVQAGEETGDIEAQRHIITRLKAQLTSDVEGQQAVLTRQRAELIHAESELQRYQELTKAGATSVAEISNKQYQVDVAQTGLREAEAQLSEIITTGQQQIEEAEARLTSLVDVQPTDVSVARAELDEARSQLQQAEVAMDAVYVRSPIAGQILRLNTQAGEVVGTQGIAEIGKTHQMNVVAEVYVSDRQYVHVGQTATVVSDYGGFSGTLTGVVESIDLQISEPALTPANLAGNTDVRVVSVTIRLNPDDSERVSMLNNLEVRAAIQID